MNKARIIGACFFLSGATALIYEVLWVRLLALYFGNTVYAVGVVLTAFMTGLSLGSVLFGRWADRGRNLIRGYAALELGAAVFALLTPVLFERVMHAYLSLSPESMSLVKVSGFRYIVSAFVMLVPATLMGGTLPILSRYFIRGSDDLKKRLGELYSLNTLGGILGTFLVGFLFIRFFGIAATLVATACVNVMIAAVAYAASGAEAAPPAAEPRAAGYFAPGYRYAVAAFFLSGFAAMVYEIAWTRLLVSVIGSATYSFSLILMGFLLGIALGSLIVSRISTRMRLGLEHFSYLELAIGVVGFCTVAYFHLFPPLMLKGLRIADSVHLTHVIEFGLVLLYILVPTTLMGATFPIIAGVYSEGHGASGRSIGAIYAANTVGAIFGSAIAAFYLMPAFGSTVTIKTASLINIAVGAAGFFFLGRVRIFAAVSGLLLLPLIPVHIPGNDLHSGVAVYGKRANFVLNPTDHHDLFLKEGLNATISVSVEDHGILSLKTNGKSDASTGRDMITQLAVGYFPMLLHPEPRDVMVIGFGSGVSVRAVADFPEVRSIECVEIEPAVLSASEFFLAVNRDVRRDPRVRISVDDARSYMLSSDRLYDVIVSEPSNPWITGVGNLYSREFFRAGRERLRDGGLYVQWVELYGLRPAELRMVLRTFSSVFPNATVWQANQTDIVIIGSNGPFPRLDSERFQGRIAGRAAWDLKAYLNISSPEDLLSYFVLGPSGVQRLAAGARMDTDDRPLLEFNAPLSMRVNSALENYELLGEEAEFPEYLGLEAAPHAVAEHFYRKSLNFNLIDLPVRPKWMLTALEAEPTNAAYLVEHAVLLAKEGDTQESLEFFDRALAIDPLSARAHHAKARHIEESDKLAALAHFERAAALGGDEFDYFFDAGFMSLSLARYDEARGYFLKAAALPHREHVKERVLYLIGYASLKIGEREEAARYFTLSYEANPMDYRHSLEIADMFDAMKEPGKACEIYEKTLALPLDDLRKEIELKTRERCGGIHHLQAGRASSPKGSRV